VSEVVTHRKILFADIFTVEFQKEVEKKLDEIAANIADARALENALRKLVVTIDFKRDVEVNRTEGLWVDTMKTIGVKLAPTRTNGCNVIVANNEHTGKPEMIRQKFTQGELFAANTSEEVNTDPVSDEYEEDLYSGGSEFVEEEEQDGDFYGEQMALAEKGLDDDTVIAEQYAEARKKSIEKLKVVK